MLSCTRTLRSPKLKLREAIALRIVKEGSRTVVVGELEIAAEDEYRPPNARLSPWTGPLEIEIIQRGRNSAAHEVGLQARVDARAANRTSDIAEHIDAPVLRLDRAAIGGERRQAGNDFADHANLGRGRS